MKVVLVCFGCNASFRLVSLTDYAIEDTVCYKHFLL